MLLSEPWRLTRRCISCIPVTGKYLNSSASDWTPSIFTAENRHSQKEKKISPLLFPQISMGVINYQARSLIFATSTPVSNKFKLQFQFTVFWFSERCVELVRISPLYYF